MECAATSGGNLVILGQSLFGFITLLAFHFWCYTFSAMQRRQLHSHLHTTFTPTFTLLHIDNQRVQPNREDVKAF